MKKAVVGSVSHTDETIKELRADRQFAVEYLKSALEELDDPDNRAAGLLALRDVAEAYGGLGRVNPGYQQLIPRARAGHVKQMPLGVIHLLQVSIVTRRLNPFLQWDTSSSQATTTTA